MITILTLQIGNQSNIWVIWVMSCLGQGGLHSLIAFVCDIIGISFIKDLFDLSLLPGNVIDIYCNYFVIICDIFGNLLSMRRIYET